MHQAPDPFNDKSNGFDGDASNEFKSDNFATAFDDNVQSAAGFGSGFDDSFSSTFAGKPSDPFAATSKRHDPFGDGRGTIPAVTPDVSKRYG